MKTAPMIALLNDPIDRLFDPAPKPAIERIIVITVEPLGARWWIVHRNDGKSGGIFDDKAGALLQARLDTRALKEAIIEVVDHEGTINRGLYIRGALSGDPHGPRLTVV